MDEGTKLRLEREDERRRKAKEETRDKGLEVLTPRAAVQLFGKSAEAVHKALNNNRVWAAFELWFTERRTPMILLSSAIAYWGEPDAQALEKMRENGLTLADDNVVYNVLHPRPLWTLSDRQELE